MTSTGITSVEIKKINRSKVFHAIYENGSISKQDLAAQLHLSLPTVTQNLKELQEMNLIEKNGLYQSTGGRKAQVISAVRTAKISIGIEILKKLVHVVAIDLYGQPLYEDTLPIFFKNEPAYFEKLCEWINAFISDLPYNASQVLGISIAIQGVTSPDGEVVVYGEIMNNAGVRRTDFARHLRWPCRLVHDSKAAANAELWQMEDTCDAMVLLLNRNMGGALILNGKVHHGRDVRSGTIEHLCIVPGGKQCYCGKRGCLEEYCSADSLRAASGEEMGVFFQKLHSGDTACRAHWDTYLRNLAFAMNNIHMVVDIEFILSGFLASYLTEEDLEDLYRYIAEFSAFPIAHDFLRISRCGPFPAARGAALYDIEEFLQTL
jgi:N-acetylglucosamine repressor